MLVLKNCANCVNGSDCENKIFFKNWFSCWVDCIFLNLQSPRYVIHECQPQGRNPSKLHLNNRNIGDNSCYSLTFGLYKEDDWHSILSKQIYRLVILGIEPLPFSLGASIIGIPMWPPSSFFGFHWSNSPWGKISLASR